jgi:hypothetical protein
MVLPVLVVMMVMVLLLVLLLMALPVECTPPAHSPTAGIYLAPPVLHARDIRQAVRSGYGIRRAAGEQHEGRYVRVNLRAAM